RAIGGKRRDRANRAMTSVTVPGPNGSTITEHFAGPINLQLAEQIAAALAAASTAGSLNITTTPAGVSPPPPPANPAGLNELVIDSGGDYTIPAGSAGAPDYVVIVDSIAAVTIHG